MERTEVSERPRAAYGTQTYSLSRSLEEQPLVEEGALLEVLDEELALLVVGLGEVEEDGLGLGEGEVAVGVVDDGGDATMVVNGAVWLAVALWESEHVAGGRRRPRRGRAEVLCYSQEVHECRVVYGRDELLTRWG